MAGLFNEKTGKLEALPAGDLAALVPGYDLVFLEGDGSRGLPLKGWAEKEPAVPPNTTITIGLIPLSPLGKKVSKDTVFRLPLFTALCGAKEGDTLSISHLAAVITGNTRAKGLFDAARGKKLLFINHVEDDAARDQARELVSLLPENFLPGLCHIIAGSVRDDRVEVLYTGEGN
jgi:probable selenium-dependent hydroxylase accessory protein YqeC